MATLDTSRLVINGLDVTQLDDDDLYTRLQDLGSPVGPIVATTRSVYQKKLYVLMGGHLPDSPTFNGDVDQEDEEYSDSEPEVVTNSPRQTRNKVVTQSSHKTVTTTSSGGGSSSQYADVRQRVLASSGGEDATDSSEMVYDPDLHTPSPRRSLRTVSSSHSETTSYRRVVNNASGSSRSAAVKAGDTVDGTSGKGSLCLRLLVKLLFLALLIAVALYVYQNSASESPFKAIEELARQAIEAAAGEESVDTPESVDQAAPVPAPPQEQVSEWPGLFHHAYGLKG